MQVMKETQELRAWYSTTYGGRIVNRMDDVRFAREFPAVGASGFFNMKTGDIFIRNSANPLTELEELKHAFQGVQRGLVGKEREAWAHLENELEAEISKHFLGLGFKLK